MTCDPHPYPTVPQVALGPRPERQRYAENSPAQGRRTNRDVKSVPFLLSLCARGSPWLHVLECNPFFFPNKSFLEREKKSSCHQIHSCSLELWELLLSWVRPCLPCYLKRTVSAFGHYGNWYTLSIISRLFCVWDV